MSPLTPGPTVGEPPAAAGVVLAGGSGTRLGAGLNKAYLTLAGRSLVGWALGALAAVPDVSPLVLVIRAEDRDQAAKVVATELDGRAVEVVTGGSARQESEHNALRHLAARVDAGAIDTVLLHDAARPLASVELITAVLRAAREHGGAVPAIPADDLAWLVPDGSPDLARPVPSMVRTQTPQAFAARPLLAAYDAAAAAGFAGTDTSAVVERFGGVPVHWVPGDPRNFKVTYAGDLAVAEQLITSAGRGR